MVTPVTIVLPVHNGERTLRPLITQILDLASAPQRRLTLAIVDDGSTDDTFETACELARDYPQVCVFRQPYQRGLGPALEDVRRQLGVTDAIVHDGVGPIDLGELAMMLQENGPSATSIYGTNTVSHTEHRGSRRFAAVAALNARMERAHRAITSFKWLNLGESTRPRRAAVPLTHLSAPLFGSDVPLPLA